MKTIIASVAEIEESKNAAVEIAIGIHQRGDLFVSFTSLLFCILPVLQWNEKEKGIQ